MGSTNTYNDKLHNSINEEFNNDYENDKYTSFTFYVYLAPYNMETEKLGKIKLYKVNSKTKVLDFIKTTFQRHEWKIVHLYDAIDSEEIDKYIKFGDIGHRHAIIQLVYIFEDDIFSKFKNKPIRGFDYLELRDNYDDELYSKLETNIRDEINNEKNENDNNNNLLNLLLKNITDKKILTKEFSVDKSTKVENFIKSNFNPTILMFQKGNLINEEKTFEENNLQSSENQYEIYYFEKKRENFSENGYIVKKYAILEKIGSGGFGKVYKAININSLKEYAIKEIDFSNINQQVDNEIFLLSNLKHKYIVKYYESFKENNYCYIVMELCSKNNLFDLTREIKKKNQSLNENFIWEIFIKICIGVGYLHKEEVIHRDLKTSNIFISKDGYPKVGDFGISKLLESGFAQSIHGTSYYAAPELWNYQKYNDKVDTWGMGCILYELCKLDYPFNDISIIALKEKICNADYPPIPENFSKNMNKAIKQLFEVDQNKRLSLKNFLIQDYIVEIAEKVGLLPDLHELYPLKIKNPDNNIINHVYNNILRRNNILSEGFFNLKYNKEPDDWREKKEKIGSYSLDYYPPNGWIGIGLNINKYNNEEDWIDKKTGWATAYHGLRLLETKDKQYSNLNCNEYDFNMILELTIKSIIENGLKNGINQPFKFEKNAYELSNNEYEYCGEGIYLSFQIEEAEKYTIPISGYIFVLMCKVCPIKIRESERFQGEFVADGNYIRPYRILAKKYKNY